MLTVVVMEELELEDCYLYFLNPLNFIIRTIGVPLLKVGCLVLTYVGSQFGKQNI
jgi:hypothetical protein